MSEEEKTANSIETAAERLKPFQWKKGQSGNPSGRPTDTLKAYQAKKYREMTPEEKEKELEKMPPELRWRMAEGNPKQDTDVTSGGDKIIPIFSGGSVNVPSNESNSQDIQP